MDWLETLVVVAHVAIAIALVTLVLLQQGKGANAGAAFGGGASQTVFGSEGSSSFLVRATTFLAILCLETSFSLAVFAKQRAELAGEAGIPTVEEPASAADEQPAEGDGARDEEGGDDSQLPDLE